MERGRGGPFSLLLFLGLENVGAVAGFGPFL